MNYKNKMFDILNFIGNLVILNILFIITSIPIFTIFSSLKSLFYTFYKQDLDKSNKSIYSLYMKSFKENIKECTFIQAIFILFCFISIYFTKNLLFIFILIFPLFLLLLLLIARYEINILNAIKNTFILSILYLFRTIIVIIINFCIYILLVNNIYLYKILPIFFIFGFSLYVYIISYIYKPIIKFIEK